MVDVDRRIPPSHAAGLRRLSTRAASTPGTTPRTRAGLHSFSSLASSLVSRFKLSSIPLTPGLTESELVRIESNLNFTIPPDLRALLSLALPSSPSFPDWRSLPSLSSLFSLPLLSLSIHTATSGTFWPASSWGPRPLDSALALATARSNLRRAPVLIPLFGRCCIPSRPSLAGNPVFYVDDTRIFICAVDLQDFFIKSLHQNLRVMAARNSIPDPIPSDETPRYIEFWTDAAASFDRRSKRSSLPSSSERSSSSSWSSSWSVHSLPDPDQFVEIRPAKVPHWVDRYFDEIGCALREGGWGESDVKEMVDVSAAWAMDCEEDVRMDVLVLRAERCGEELRRAGWAAEEVAEVLGLNFGEFFGRRESNYNKRVVKLPPGIQFKVDRLAEEFVR